VNSCLAALVVSTLAGAPSQPSAHTQAVDQPGAAEPAADPALDAELREIDARAAAIHDLTASFEQTRTSLLLRKPLVSEGTVAVKGARTLWRTVSPRRSTMLIDSAEMRLYYPDQGVVEVYELTDSLKRIAATPLPRLDAVRRHFSIARVGTSDGPRDLVIDLTPRDPDLRERVHSVRVTIDRTTALASTITITDADGEETVIRFTQSRTNTGLDDASLDLNVPEGTRISRPLDGLPQAPPARTDPEPPR